MFWVGLATLIMMLNGSGDDTREFRRRAEAMHKATQKVIADTKRQKEAEQALKATMKAFVDHRKRLDLMAQCVIKADANYQATPADYEACIEDLESVWESATDEFVVAEQSFRAAVTAEELRAIKLEVGAK